MLILCCFFWRTVIRTSQYTPDPWLLVCTYCCFFCVSVAWILIISLLQESRFFVHLWEVQLTNLVYRTALNILMILDVPFFSFFWGSCMLGVLLREKYERLLDHDLIMQLKEKQHRTFFVKRNIRHISLRLIARKSPELTSRHDGIHTLSIRPGRSPHKNIHHCRCVLYKYSRSTSWVPVAPFAARRLRSANLNASMDSVPVVSVHLLKRPFLLDLSQYAGLSLMDTNLTTQPSVRPIHFKNNYPGASVGQGSAAVEQLWENGVPSGLEEWPSCRFLKLHFCKDRDALILGATC